MSAIITITLVLASCTESDSRSEIVALQKIYDQLSQAMADQDTAKVMSFIDPEAEFIDPQSNRTTAAQYRADYEKFFAVTKDNKVTCTLPRSAM